MCVWRRFHIQRHRIFPLCHSLERIIVFDRSVRISSHYPAALYFDDFLKLGQGLPRQTEVEALYKQANNEDICNILYTSGTTGESKGVVLTYGQFCPLRTFSNADGLTYVSRKDRTSSSIPTRTRYSSQCVRPIPPACHQCHASGRRFTRQ